MKMPILQTVKKTIWKLIKQNKLFDGIFDVIFDDPYLTEQKDSANVAHMKKVISKNNLVLFFE